MSDWAKNQSYIRKGVELADGWYITHIYAGENIVAWTNLERPPSFVLQCPTLWCLDALAAQLVRQYLLRAIAGTYTAWHSDPLKTIKWIVDNKVLEG